MYRNSVSMHLKPYINVGICINVYLLVFLLVLTQFPFFFRICALLRPLILSIHISLYFFNLPFSINACVRIAKYFAPTALKRR